MALSSIGMFLGLGELVTNSHLINLKGRGRWQSEGLQSLDKSCLGFVCVCQMKGKLAVNMLKDRELGKPQKALTTAGGKCPQPVSVALLEVRWALSKSRRGQELEESVTSQEGRADSHR